jgi:putative sigma-54 modulation protein
MSIEVTGRHMHATQRTQEEARAKAEVLMESFPNIENVHVILDVEKHRKIAELVVQVKHHGIVEAKDSSDNLLVSLDMATEKVERQLRKFMDKLQDHKPAMKQSETARSAVGG